MSSWGWGSKISNLQQVGDFFFLGSKSVIFSLHLKNNFECQLGGVGQKIKFFVGGAGIKVELWWGVSSFSGGWGA